MFAIQQSVAESDECIPNILPCRIQHDGPTHRTRRFWVPTTDKEGSQTAYYRGRKLKGRVVKLPRTYKGLVIRKVEKTLPQPPARRPISHYEDEDSTSAGEGEEEEEEEAEPVKVLEQVSSFPHLIIWGHDQLPAADDAHVKGIEEWISFAEAIHGSNPTSQSCIEDVTKTKG